MRRRLAFAVTLLGLSLAARWAFAQRVLVLRPDEHDATLSEAFNRLRAELRLQDFEVVVLDSTLERVTPEMLEAEAQKRAAFAGIALSRLAGGASADVCIADRVTGKTSQRRLAIASTRDAPGVLAVRAVDLLRASLRELPAGESPPADVVGVVPGPIPVAVRAFTAEHQHWQLGAAGVVLDSGAELGVALGGSVSLFYRPNANFGLGLAFTGPLIGSRYAALNGAATLQQALLLARAEWNVLPAGRWLFGPSAAAGVYHLRAQGEVNAPLTGRTADVWSFAAGGGIDAGFKITEALMLGASLTGLFLTPKPVVAVDTSERELREPIVSASLGLGVAF